MQAAVGAADRALVGPREHGLVIGRIAVVGRAFRSDCKAAVAAGPRSANGLVERGSMNENDSVTSPQTPWPGTSASRWPSRHQLDFIAQSGFGRTAIAYCRLTSA